MHTADSRLRQERSRLLAQAGQFGPRGVEVTLGALGAGAQLAARFLEHLGAGFQRGAQLVALAGRVGAQLLELPRGILSGPRGFRAGVLGAGLGCGGALFRALSGLPVLFGLLARPVPVGLGGPDEGLGVGAGLAGQFLGLPLGLGDPGLGGAYRGVGVGLGTADCLGRLGMGLGDRCSGGFLGGRDAALGVSAGSLELLRVLGGRSGELISGLAGAVLGVLGVPGPLPRLRRWPGHGLLRR